MLSNSLSFLIRVLFGFPALEKVTLEIVPHKLQLEDFKKKMAWVTNWTHYIWTVPSHCWQLTPATIRKADPWHGQESSDLAEESQTESSISQGPPYTQFQFVSYSLFCPRLKCDIKLRSSVLKINDLFQASFMWMFSCLSDSISFLLQTPLLLHPLRSLSSQSFLAVWLFFILLYFI